MVNEFFRVLDAADDHPGIPWPCLASFVPRVWENHRLTTNALADRGVTAGEAVAILEDRPLKIMNLDAALKRLDDLIAVWRAGRCRVAWGRYHGRFQGIEAIGGLGGSGGPGPGATGSVGPPRRNVRRGNRPRPSGW